MLYTAKSINDPFLVMFILGLYVLLSATVRGMAFPIVHHIGAEKAKSGREISNVYFSNVFGSALSPILIGFVLLDYLSTESVYFFICILTLLASLICTLPAFKRNFSPILGVVFTLAAGITCFVTFKETPNSEKLFYVLSSNSYYENSPPEVIIENKYGFIQVYNSQDRHSNTLVTYGNNAYDGRINTNVFDPSNGIERAYFLGTVNPDIENILVIGLSSGAWVKVLTDLPNVKSIKVIEINPAYEKLISQNDTVKSLLKDPRLEIIYDDGRKWLRKNANGKQFDLVVANTTWHWRNYSTNMLSKEFQTLIKSVMKDNAFYYYNSTRSIDAYRTTKEVFPYTYQHHFMVVGSNAPITVDENAINERMCAMRDSSTKKPIFSSKEMCDKATKVVLKKPLIPYEKMSKSEFKQHTPEVISDNNLIPEYKYGLNSSL